MSLCLVFSAFQVLPSEVSTYQRPLPLSKPDDTQRLPSFPSSSSSVLFSLLLSPCGRH